MTKYISFKKYKEYLENLGYSEESVQDFDSPVWMQDVYFSNENDPDKYIVTVFCKLHKKPLIRKDTVYQIRYGRDRDIKNIKIDKRKKFWKQFF